MYIYEQVRLQGSNSISQNLRKQEESLKKTDDLKREDKIIFGNHFNNYVFYILIFIYKSVEKCLHTVCFSNPTTCINTLFFRVTKLSTPNVKRNYYTWAIPMCALLPAPLSSLLTL